MTPAEKGDPLISRTNIGKIMVEAADPSVDKTWPDQSRTKSRFFQTEGLRIQ